MKKLLSVLWISVFVVSTSCSQSPDSLLRKNKDAPKIEFENQVHDFGTILQGGDGKYEFVFTNTGKEPLILNNVKSSCGCTKPEWSAEPVKQGEKAVVKVGYNTKLVGPFTKTITVFSNASNSTVTLTIKGTVTPAEPPAEQPAEKPAEKPAGQSKK
ncbi:MAG: hypothetical protein H6Q21_551 [Bacteroidetes bacterium]|jgi:hypothetical protein|nr:hypothetical protein [Bacteroidota bacterium]